MDDNPFGSLLRQLRVAAGLSQEALAGRAQISTNAIGALERGISARPHPQTMRHLADALRLDRATRVAFIRAGLSDRPIAIAPPSLGDQRRLSPPPYPVDVIPPVAQSPLPNNVPAAVSTLIDRERELSELIRLLYGEARLRLLTLTGAGGCGKTRLALEVADGVVASSVDGDDLARLRYTDEVWVVEVASLTDPALVPSAVAETLGVHEEVGQPLLAAISARLQRRRVLLVLDNCEHLNDACGRLAGYLLRTCPSLTILATSRRLLGVTGEHTFHVPPLPVSATSPLERDHDSAAVLLFVERARMIVPTFQLNARNADTVVKICRDLDGIPLAIELAAAQTAFLSVDQIAARLTDRFRLLVRGHRAALPHHRTLRAAIDWSYDRLDPSERQLFHRLAIFAGDFSLESAEVVCSELESSPTAGAPAPVSVSDVLVRLSSLVEQSIVFADVSDSREARYRVLETLRQYARERLIASGEEAAISRAHATFYLGQVAAAAAGLIGPTQGEWLDRLDREHNNIRAALAWSLERDPLAGVRCLPALVRFWRRRGYLTEGRRWGEALLARLAEAEVSAQDAPTAPAVEVAARIEVGLLIADQGDYTRALATLVSAQTLLPAVPIDPAVAWTLSSVTQQILRWSGAPTDQLARALAEHLALTRQLGDPRALAWVVVSIGDIAATEGQDDVALARYSEALDGFLAVVDPWSEANVRMRLGLLALVQADYNRAHAELTECLRLNRQLKNKLGIALAHVGLAKLALLEGDDATGAVYLKECLPILRDSGRPAFGDALALRAELSLRQGDVVGAVRWYAAASRTYPSHGDDWHPLLRRAIAPDPDARIELARRQIGEVAFQRAWAQGQALTAGDME